MSNIIIYERDLPEDYSQFQLGEMPMTVTEFVERSKQFQSIISKLIENLLHGASIEWGDLGKADWIVFSIYHWEKRLVESTKWIEIPTFKLFDCDGGEATGATAHSAALTIGYFLDPAFGSFIVDGKQIPEDVVGWNHVEMRKLLAKLHQECILLKEHSFDPDESFSMKALSLALDLSDSRLKHYCELAGLGRGNRGKQRFFSSAEVRDICETILDSETSTEVTKKTAMNVLNSLQ